METKFVMDPASTKIRGAVFSEDGTRRLTLWRQLELQLGAVRRGVVLWIMLNPSTAGAVKDDPTIRKVMGFSERWGFDQVFVMNLFDVISTDPGILKTHPAPCADDHDTLLRKVASSADLTVVAWGAHAPPKRADAVLAFLPGPVCLGKTKEGHPRHPLYLKYEEPVVFFHSGEALHIYGPLQ